MAVIEGQSMIEHLEDRDWRLGMAERGMIAYRLRTLEAERDAERERADRLERVLYPPERTRAAATPAGDELVAIIDRHFC